MRDSLTRGIVLAANLTREEVEILRLESSLKVSAKNPHSTAFGLPQMIESQRVKYAKKFNYHPETTDAMEQVMMFKEYVKDRYGDPQTAYKHKLEKGWY